MHDYADDSEIRLETQEDIDYWLDRLDVSKDELADAVREKGIRVGDLVVYLEERAAAEKATLAPDRRAWRRDDADPR